MTEGANPRVDWVLRCYVQNAEKVQIWIENLPSPPLSFPYQWTTSAEVSSITTVKIVVHSICDLDAIGQKAVLKTAEVKTLEGLKQNPDYEKLASGEYKPKLTDQEKVIIEFFEQLKEGIEKLKRSLIIDTGSDVSPEELGYPNSFQYHQEKFTSLAWLMLMAGSPPGQKPIDQTIHYEKLNRGQILEWLEQMSIPARSQIAPFRAPWADLLKNGTRLPSQKSVEKFFGLLIDCFVMETQLVVNQFYYERLQIDLNDIPISILAQFIHEEELHRMRVEKIIVPEIRELYARNFLDFHILMVRALWDKTVRLACLAFGLNPNTKSVSKSLENLESLHEISTAAKPFFDVFISIAKEQLKDKEEGGWLRLVRDSLTHDTGQHSFGVLPQAKSIATSFELWNRIKLEQNWLREALMALLTTLLLYAWVDTKDQ